MKHLVSILLAALLVACVQPKQQEPEWQLMPATAVADSRHLIVTVPLADPAKLRAIAAALEADYGIVLVSEWPLKSIDVHCLVFRTGGGANATQIALASLAQDARVRTVQPMLGFDTLTADYADELFDLQDGLHAIAAPRIHSVATGRGVRVAVVDTLADEQHPDLANRVQLSRDFVGNREPPVPEVHGTAVAAVIAADGANRKGMVGVAPDADLLALRACWEDSPGAPGRCTSFSLARALNFVLLNDVDVVNLSLGGPYDPLLEELVETMVSRGIIVVAARGEAAEPAFPASVPGVIAVSTAPRADSIPPVPAPGTDILSAAPGEGFDFYSGSSVAAAHVTGIAALLLETRPDLTPRTLRQSLTAANRVPPDLVTVDACAALQAATGSRERC